MRRCLLHGLRGCPARRMRRASRSRGQGRCGGAAPAVRHMSLTSWPESSILGCVDHVSAGRRLSWSKATGVLAPPWPMLQQPSRTHIGVMGELRPVECLLQRHLRWASPAVQADLDGAVQDLVRSGQDTEGRVLCTVEDRWLYVRHDLSLRARRSRESYHKKIPWLVPHPLPWQSRLDIAVVSEIEVVKVSSEAVGVPYVLALRPVSVQVSQRFHPEHARRLGIAHGPGGYPFGPLLENGSNLWDWGLPHGAPVYFTPTHQDDYEEMRYVAQLSEGQYAGEVHLGNDTSSMASLRVECEGSTGGMSLEWEVALQGKRNDAGPKTVQLALGPLKERLELLELLFEDTFAHG